MKIKEHNIVNDFQEAADFERDTRETQRIIEEKYYRGEMSEKEACERLAALYENFHSTLRVKLGLSANFEHKLK